MSATRYYSCTVDGKSYEGGLISIPRDYLLLFLGTGYDSGGNIAATEGPIEAFFCTAVFLLELVHSLLLGRRDDPYDGLL